MQIGVNCVPLEPGVGGVRQYFITLFNWLLKNDGKNKYIFFYSGQNLDALELLEPQCWRRLAIRVRNQEEIASHLDRLDLYFCPLTILWPRPVAIPSVLTLPDIQEVYYPEFFRTEELCNRAWHYPASTSAAERVVTVSRFSRESILKHHRLHPSKVIVAYHCTDPLYFNTQALAEPSYALPFSRFVFFPANRWAHKNHDGLLNAIRLLKNLGETVNAVFTGFDVNGGFDVRRKAVEYGISAQVHDAGFVTVPQLAQIYRTAEMVVFPSLFEGFGLPLVEAMAAGCPIAASAASCVPEICGDAAEYFEPKDPAQIAAAIVRIRSDSALRARLIEKGIQRAREFSPEAMGNAHLRAFQEAAEAYSNSHFRYQRHFYQPYFKWRVDKISALQLPHAGGLYYPWAQKVALQFVKFVRGLCKAPWHWLRQLTSLNQLLQIQKSGLLEDSYYRSQLDPGPGVSNAGHYLLEGARAGLRPNPIFDGTWYLRTNPDVAAAGWNPLVHFIHAGAKEHRNPHPLFDVAWYLEQYPDVARSKWNGLTHFLKAGAQEGRDPHPLFQTRHYLRSVEDYDAASGNPLAHYLAQPPTRAKDPHPLFDGAWYLHKNPDVCAAGCNPLVHYVSMGAFEGRDPNSSFNTAEYLLDHPDVKESGMVPLLHYIGIKPALQAEIDVIEASGLFDERLYRSQVEIAPNASPILHYVYTGHRLGLNPHRFFDGGWYYQTNPDVAAVGVNPFLHFITHGLADDRDPHPLFDISQYLEEHPDVAASGLHPLRHFMEIGRTQDHGFPLLH